MSKTFIFIPPVRKITGGVAVLTTLAVMIRRAGFEVIAAVREPESVPERIRALPWVAFDQAKPGPSDIWLVPEGWPNALAPGLAAKARCMVYCQNWAYLFNGLPAGVGWENLPVSFLAVSHPVALYIEKALGAAPAVLPPGIDLARFHPPKSKPPASPARVAFMPRKNRALAEQIMAFTEARRGATGFGVQWVALENLDQDGVAEALRGCHIFLATGYPEGFALPPLEAMACGCLPVGFTGFGGWEYMRQARPDDPAPSFPLRPVPWGGNGLYAHDGDALGAALALEEALCWTTRDDPRRKAALNAGQETVKRYGLDDQFQNVASLWTNLMSGAASGTLPAKNQQRRKA